MAPGTEGQSAAALSREQKLELWRLSKGKPAVPQRKPLGAISSGQANSKRSRISTGSSGMVTKKAKILGRSSISSIGSTSDSAVDMSAVTDVSESSLDASSITDSSLRLSTGSAAGSSSTGGCGDGVGKKGGSSDSEASPHASSKGGNQDEDVGVETCHSVSGDGVGGGEGGGEDDMAEGGSMTVEQQQVEEAEAEADQDAAAVEGETILGELSAIEEAAGSQYESIEDTVSLQEAGNQESKMIPEAKETAAVDQENDQSASHRESFILISPPKDLLSQDDELQEEIAAHRSMAAKEEQTSTQGGGATAARERRALEEQLLATTTKLAQCTALLQAALQDNARLTEQAEQAIALRCRCEALEAAAGELRQLAQTAPAQSLQPQDPSPEEQESICKMREQMAKQASQFAEERGRIVAKLIASEERARKAEAGIVAAEKEAEVAVAEADEHWQNLFNTQMVTLQQQLQLALAAKAAAAPKPAE